MIKFLFILCCFLSVQKDEPVISWSESNKLSWVDFKAKPNNEMDAVALTASGITFGTSIKQLDHKILSFKTHVEAHFYPERSWYKIDRVNTNVLAHEQLHFNITELFTRKFRQRIEQLKVSNSIRNQLKAIHNAINKELAQMQNDYDTETNHSRNIEAQAKWQNLVAVELKKFSKYKSDD